MEILFENNYTRNKELAKEIYSYYYFKRKGLVFLYVIFAFCLVFNVILGTIYDGGNLDIVNFLLFFYVFQFLCYRYQVNTMCKRDMECHGKEIYVETVVTDSFIQNTASTGSVNKLDYCNVRNAVQTKNLILLRSKANLIYIFRKDTFTKGTPDEFISFLKSKGIKVKR